MEPNNQKTGDEKKSEFFIQPDKLERSMWLTRDLVTRSDALVLSDGHLFNNKLIKQIFNLVKFLKGKLEIHFYTNLSN